MEENKDYSNIYEILNKIEQILLITKDSEDDYNLDYYKKLIVILKGSQSVVSNYLDNNRDKRIFLNLSNIMRRLDTIAARIELLLMTIRQITGVDIPKEANGQDSKDNTVDKYITLYFLQKNIRDWLGLFYGCYGYECVQEQGGTSDIFKINIAQKQDTQPQAAPPHFTTPKTEKELTCIFESLKEGKYIAPDSLLPDWLYICKGSGNGTSIGKITWTAKNSRTRQPSKKSLLDLLVVMGYKEMDIRSMINDCFVVDGAAKYTTKDYTGYRDWQRNIESEYHERFKEIVTKSKDNQ